MGGVCREGEFGGVGHCVANYDLQETVTSELGDWGVWGERGRRERRWLTRSEARFLLAETRTCISLIAAGWGAPWLKLDPPSVHHTQIDRRREGCRLTFSWTPH